MVVKKGSGNSPLMALSDHELVTLCNDGDADSADSAFTTLYHRHKDFVLRIANRFVPDVEMALDVLQETFSYLLTKFPPQGTGLKLSSRLTTLLYPVAKNTALNMVRQQSRYASTDRAELDHLIAPTAQTSDVAQLLQAMEQIPSERREVLMLRFVDDFSLAEIGDVLEIPVGTVKSRLHLGIKALKTAPEIKNFFNS